MNWKHRSENFCRQFGLQVPILLGPMAGVPAPQLSIAVANAGGAGSCGALLMKPEEIEDWYKKVRAATDGSINMNLWVPDKAPVRDAEHEARIRKFLARFGPEPAANAGDTRPPDFEAQLSVLLELAPDMVSSVMGLFPADFVAELKKRGIKWLAVATTVGEAVQAEAAGADAIAAQGMEAGGHRGCFEPEDAERRLVGLLSLIPAVVDSVKVPVIAAGGIADGRTMAAALLLGASAVQIGTAFLRAPEAEISPAWSDAIGNALPEDTVLSRVFSGRAGRSLETAYVKAAMSADAPTPAPYPVQRGLTAAMRSKAKAEASLDGMQAWAGQSARLSKALPAAEIVKEIWQSAQDLLGN